MQLPTKTLLALLPYVLQVQAGASGTGSTTRYWDCCKPSCAWPGKTTLAAGSNPVTTCDISNNPLTDYNAASGCNGGTAFQCSNESPWAVTDDLAYGYAAVNIAGGSEASWCCACYQLTFTSGPVAGKKMIVQATNTGGDLGSNQFDLSIPGGGVGIFNGCTAEWGAPSSGWGAQYGGISDQSACATFPEALQAGCNWRFDWFKGADNPSVSFEQVACPAALTKNTGCARADDSSESAAPVVSASVVPEVATTSSPSEAATTSTTAVQVQPATTSHAQSETTSSSTPVVVVPASSSTPSDSPGAFAQTPSPSAVQESSTPSVTPTPTSTPSSSVEPEMVTVTIDACEL